MSRKVLIRECDNYNGCSYDGFSECGNYENNYKNNIIFFGRNDFITFNNITDEFNLLDDDTDEIDLDSGIYGMSELYNSFMVDRGKEIIIKNLSKKTNKKGVCDSVNGRYSQNDGCYIFYTDDIKSDDIDYLTDLYFGNYKEFNVFDSDEYNVGYLDMVNDTDYYKYGNYVKVFSNRLGIKEKNIKVELIAGYERVAKYKSEI